MGGCRFADFFLILIALESDIPHGGAITNTESPRYIHMRILGFLYSSPYSIGFYPHSL
jgi:hypothetical protein